MVFTGLAFEGKGKQGPIAFAIFLCSIGVVLSVIAVAKLGIRVSKPDAGTPIVLPTSEWPVIWFGAFVLAIAALFIGVNFRVLSKRSAGSRRPSSRAESMVDAARAATYRLIAARWAQVLTGIFLLLVSFYAALQIVVLTTQIAPPAEKFALVFQPAKPAAKETPALGVASKAEKPSAPAATAAPTPPAETPKWQAGEAVLFWTVPGSQPNPREGLLAMFMGCLLVVAFGLFYPQMNLSGASDIGGFLQKLVIPLMSLGLFGVGVQQQAQAEQTRQDVELAKQGVPPVMFLDPKDRYFVLNRDSLPASTRKYLNQKFGDQIENIAGGDYSDHSSNTTITTGDMASLTAELVELRRAINSRPNAPIIVQESPLLDRLIGATNRVADNVADNTGRTSAAITAAAGQTSGELATMRGEQAAQAAAQRERDCEMLRLSAKDTGSREAQLYWMNRDADTKRKADIFRTALIALKGEDTREVDKGSVARDASAQTSFQNAVQALSQVCGVNGVAAR